jgi:hypothetical protein
MARMSFSSPQLLSDPGYYKAINVPALVPEQSLPSRSRFCHVHL